MLPDGRAGEGRRGSATLVLFSFTVFLGAALLFLVEPMVAKLALPLFGGTPAVWTGSMLFFQATLLAGYLYAHAAARWLGARRAAAVHLGVLLLALPLLPLSLSEGWAPQTGASPIPGLLGLLAFSVGLPFFAVSATSLLVQSWLSDTDLRGAQDPYFLYAASNLGSILGLLAYPFLIEPRLGLEDQNHTWAAGYSLLAALVFASALALWRSPRARAAAARGSDATPGVPLSEEPPATFVRKVRWVGLAFVASSLLLGVTVHLTTDVAPFPLLWVVPLTLYLLTFAIAFAPGQERRERSRRLVATGPLAAVLLAALVGSVEGTFWAIAALHLAGFFVVTLVCHTELARDRPPPRYLTEFFLLVALGGTLGGAFNALVAPWAFESVVEYPLAIALACLLIPLRVRGGAGSAGGRPRGFAPWRLDLFLPLLLGAAVAALVVVASYAPEPEGKALLESYATGLGLGLCLSLAYFSGRPARFALAVAAVMLAGALPGALPLGPDGPTLFRERSFFGVYSVETTGSRHELINGTTLHGAQDLSQNSPVPLTYYHPEGPIGDVMNVLPDGATNRSAVVGLGAGSMACHAERGERWTFYEIDPAVERIARDESLFTYLSDCPGEHRVVLGDARISLEDAPDGIYGLIVNDAFSSDAIPVHLLTREAIDLYFAKLDDDGVLATHVSNRHLELEPVLGNAAREAGLACRARVDDVPGEAESEKVARRKSPSHWVVMARPFRLPDALASDPRWHPCAAEPRSRVWTDDYSNVVGAFR